MDLPRNLILSIDMNIFEDIAYKLSQTQNCRIDEILGRYFLKITNVCWKVYRYTILY